VDAWAKDHAMREALCDELSGLDASQWDVQSLCAEWKVRHVVGHLISYTDRTARALITGLVGNGMSQTRFIARARRSTSFPELLSAHGRRTPGRTSGILG
jgi:uncharacterized protein (TIGR03083 family)